MTTLMRFLLLAPLVFIESMWYVMFLIFEPTSKVVTLCVVFHFFFLPVVVLLCHCLKYVGSNRV